MVGRCRPFHGFTPTILRGSASVIHGFQIPEEVSSRYIVAVILGCGDPQALYDLGILFLTTTVVLK